jgi:membrane protein
MANPFRGRRAYRPAQIGVAGWLDIAWRVKQKIEKDKLTMLAAGIAFYALLSLFPAIAAIISLWALVLDPQDMVRQIGELARIFPLQGAELIQQQAREIGSTTDTGLSLTALGSLLVAMYVASKGVHGLIVGLNVVYGERERRSAFRRGLLRAAMTLGLVVITQVTIVFITVFPLAIGLLGLDSFLFRVVAWLRWPLLLVAMMLVISIFYRVAPYRREPRWRWVSVGSVTATLLWLLGSAGLSLYVSRMADLTELYGTLGAVVVLMLWFWISAFVVLLGAEINGEMERQTRRDTTIGESRPRGERGAHVADTLGPPEPWRSDDNTDHGGRP